MTKTELGKNLIKYFEKEVPSRKTKARKFEILRSVKEELKEIRENGFSYRDIVKALKAFEVEVSLYHVKEFFIQEMGEETVKRKTKKSKKTKKNAKEIEKNNKKTEEKRPFPPAPGFRIIDDDI